MESPLREPHEQDRELLGESVRRAPAAGGRGASGTPGGSRFKEGTLLLGARPGGRHCSRATRSDARAQDQSRTKSGEKAGWGSQESWE